MGMTEERRNWAANAEAEAERLYRETTEPYYAVLAIAAARRGDFIPPDWATDVLFKALDSAVLNYQTTGAEISLDKELGLKGERGKSSPGKRAERAMMDRWVFSDILILHTCFDISIPDACELVYNEPDFSFARSMEEAIGNVVTLTDQQLANLGMTRVALETVNKETAERNKRIIQLAGNNTQVRKKLESRKWWEITTGERLGYGLETLIEKYYRFQKRDLLPSYNMDLKAMHFRGLILLNGHTVRASAIGSTPADIRRQPLKHLGRKPGLENLVRLASGVLWDERGVLRPVT